MNVPQTEGRASSGKVSLVGRLAWLGAALWLIAVKSVVVVEYTPVELTTDAAFAMIYGTAFGMPAAVIVAWIIRSGVRFAWKPGLIAALMLSAYLYGFAASGLLSHLMFTSSPWRAETVLYIHQTDPDRTIERQVKYTAGRRVRFVQQRALMSFLAYAESVEFSEIREREAMEEEWRPTPASSRFLR